MKYYTGIGSRATPKDKLDLITEISEILSKKGYILRSGKAEGADYAFEVGAEEAELYIPWSGFCSDRNVNTNHRVYVRGSDVESKRIASNLHPAWDRLSRGASALHTRNVNQVLGKNSSDPDPSEFVIFYAEEKRNGDVKGGTATAVKLARNLNIPTLNLLNVETSEDVLDWIEGIHND